MGHNVHTKTGIKSKLLEKAWQKGLVQTLSVSLGSQPGKLQEEFISLVRTMPLFISEQLPS